MFMHEDLWGTVRRHSRLDPFPYLEPLTNLASYFGVRGISDEQTNEIEPEPTKYVLSGVAKLYGPECGLSSGLVCALLDRAAWECPLSRGCVTDTHEKELPLPIYELKVEG
ncbi:hypothetical protein CRG98_029786 [Punica granatum]|uniref:Uncharacterized protein n=1 Tax=Punica granatum TaxID=22663 RepID=A0A2I0J0P2_PUNGR|nr:hypothetical protein CRG98_029786 [Punica granatum]